MHDQRCAKPVRVLAPDMRMKPVGAWLVDLLTESILGLRATHMRNEQ